MIDAYEIGIQLLLQEDVSAGLAVINRELAEVDQAIAATSARLAGLVHGAEVGTKAVAVAGSERKSPAPAQLQEASGPAEQVVQGQPATETIATPVINSSQKSAAPETTAAEPTMPTLTPTISPPTDEQQAPPQNTRQLTPPSSAPVRSGMDQAVSSNQRATDTQAEPVPPVANAPVPVAPTAQLAPAAAAQIAPSAPAPVAPLPPPVQAVATRWQEPRRSVTPSPKDVAMTASVRRREEIATAPTLNERARQQPISGPEARRERPAAPPWSGIDYLGAQAEKARSHEKAAAPQSVNRTQSESGGGSVMLDGRLVGQWLSEHMAREASRPPAGTSFFDARQTPAWNVSGAL